ncbi:hypothetical protein SUDANB140_02025 [Streptomyces sp. enrichment culture]
MTYADPPDPLRVDTTVLNVHDHSFTVDPDYRPPALPAMHDETGQLHCTEVPVRDAAYARELAQATGNWRILEPSPRVMRVVSSTYDTAPLAEDGKNLGAVLGRIAREPESWYDYRADAVALLPDLVDITVAPNTEWGQWDVWLQHQHEHRVPPGAASAGTLRILALLAAAHDPAHEGLLMIEEPENGLHPTRVPHLLSRLKGRTSDPVALVSGDGQQVLITSHSPVALAAALEDAPDTVVFLDTVTRFRDGLPPHRLTRARKVADNGERGAFVTPLEVSTSC